MDKRFPQYDELDLPKVAEEVLKQWETEDTFGKSLERYRVTGILIRQVLTFAIFG